MIPDVLSERLDSLVGLLDSAGARSTRADIVGALLLAVEPDADSLDELVRTYRNCSVRDAYLGSATGDGMRLAPTAPGPRSRR